MYGKIVTLEATPNNWCGFRYQLNTSQGIRNWSLLLLDIQSHLSEIEYGQLVKAVSYTFAFNRFHNCDSYHCTNHTLLQLNLVSSMFSLLSPSLKDSDITNSKPVLTLQGNPILCFLYYLISMLWMLYLT